MRRRCERRCERTPLSYGGTVGTPLVLAAREGPRGRAAGQRRPAGGCMKSRPTVLLVEDDPDLTRFADLALRLSGYRAVTAADGISAVLAARRERPDVGVLDHR